MLSIKIEFWVDKNSDEMEIKKINDSLTKDRHEFKITEKKATGIYLTDKINPSNKHNYLLLVSESIINNLLDIMAEDVSEEEADNLSPESLSGYYKEIDMFDNTETWALFYHDPR